MTTVLTDDRLVHLRTAAAILDNIARRAAADHDKSNFELASLALTHLGKLKVPVASSTVISFPRGGR